MKFDFEYEYSGQLVTVLSLKTNGNNRFRDFFSGIDNKTKSKLLARIETFSNTLGFQIRNKNIFKKLSGYKNIYEIILKDPVSIRILATRYDLDSNNTLILLLGLYKTSEKSQTKHRNKYSQAEHLAKQIKENKDELEQKLRRIYKRI